MLLRCRCCRAPMALLQLGDGCFLTIQLKARNCPGHTGAHGPSRTPATALVCSAPMCTPHCTPHSTLHVQPQYAGPAPPAPPPPTPPTPTPTWSSRMSRAKSPMVMLCPRPGGEGENSCREGSRSGSKLLFGARKSGAGVGRRLPPASTRLPHSWRRAAGPQKLGSARQGREAVRRTSSSCMYCLNQPHSLRGSHT